MDLIGYAAIALLALVLVVVPFLYRRRRGKARAHQVKELEYLLDRVAEAANKRKVQLYDAGETGEYAALAALRAAAEVAPVDISAELEQIEARWQRLSGQLAEFADQSAQSTLQSSVVTSRAEMTAKDIAQLTVSAKTKLAKYR